MTEPQTTDAPCLIPLDSIAELRRELDTAGQHPHPDMRDGLSYAALFPHVGPLLDTAEQAHRLRAENERLRDGMTKDARFWAEEWQREYFLRGEVQADACDAIGRDPCELYPVFDAVQKQWVSLARAVEYARDWLTGLPCEPPTKSPFDEESERI